MLFPILNRYIYSSSSCIIRPGSEITSRIENIGLEGDTYIRTYIVYTLHRYSLGAFWISHHGAIYCFRLFAERISSLCWRCQDISLISQQQNILVLRSPQTVEILLCRCKQMPRDVNWKFEHGTGQGYLTINSITYWALFRWGDRHDNLPLHGSEIGTVSVTFQVVSIFFSCIYCLERSKFMKVIGKTSAVWIFLLGV